MTIWAVPMYYFNPSIRETKKKKLKSNKKYLLKNPKNIDLENVIDQNIRVSPLKLPSLPTFNTNGTIWEIPTS